VRNAHDQVEAFNKAEVRLGGRSGVRHSSVVEVWQKPPVGSIKVNWDAAVDKEGNRIGLGIVVRDHNGQVVAMQCSTRQFICDPATAEALAAWTAVSLCGSLGLQSVVLEGDACEVVQYLRTDGICRGTYGQIINDAKFLLSHVPEWRVQHVRRTANTAAHRIARLAVVHGENRIWRDEFPICIEEDVTV
jgi:ribonuclease HI